jgi:hypothetical protein
VPAESDAINGGAGRYFGAFTSYLPRHAGFVASAAPTFLLHPVPVLALVALRADLNELSCNWTSLSYCR